MKEEIKDNRFMFNILQSLEPMGKIECTVIDNSIIGLYKDDILFGFILGADLYLRTSDENEEAYEKRLDIMGKKFNKLRKNFLYHRDSFLQIATKSYWVAVGKR